MRFSWHSCRESSLCVQASIKNFTQSVPALLSSVHHGQDIVLGQNQVLLPLESDLGPRVGAENHPVLLLDLKLGALAVLEELPRSDRHHHALLGLFLCRVRQHNAALGSFLSLDALDHDLIV